MRLSALGRLLVVYSDSKSLTTQVSNENMTWSRITMRTPNLEVKVLEIMLIRLQESQGRYHWFFTTTR